MSKTRDNHYVPQWYQKGFLFTPTDKLWYLDLNPDEITLPNGNVKQLNSLKNWTTPQCFAERDLYTTFFGLHINDEIEQKLFGKIDNTGSKAVRAFIDDNVSEWHTNFSEFFIYIDAQKIRTPKGLDWIRGHYPDLNQNELMREMQGIRNMHCTIWSEGVREIVSAKSSNVKFILSDHPVTIYNHALSPDDIKCAYPDDPVITLKGTQTIFPLDKDHCLILTNYEYAKNPENENPTERRTFARHNRNSMVRTDAFIKTRQLAEEDVKKINLILKTRARRYIAAPNKEWLYPEKHVQFDWSELRHVLLPPDDELWHFGGEMYVGYSDGSTYYQDAFGRTTPENPYLKKAKIKGKLKPNDNCGCGYGKKYKKCCMNKSASQRPSWDELSIRERNIIFSNGINDILGLSKGKTWNDVQKELSDEQVKKIHELYGFLWPIETDILSLLPKPDGNFRVVYTGIIDPRVTFEFLPSVTAYFDEVIVVSPFINPNCVNPDFSPVHNPSQHKLQALKNILLFMTLLPFIENGYINFIPDPCGFDGHLRGQMFDMAKERAKIQKIKNKDQSVMEWLHKDDFQRMLCMLPKNWQKTKITEAMPDLNETEIEEMLEYIEEIRHRDPLALLQEDVYTGEGGQLNMMCLAPNFEISLYLCQVTGSCLLTDSLYRWEEAKKAQYREGGVVGYSYPYLTNGINNLNYFFNRNPETIFHLRKSGKLGNFRQAFKEMYLSIQQNNGDPTKITQMDQVSQRRIIDAHKNEKLNSDETSFKGKLDCLIPDGGIVHNNVQRMLLSSGNDNHLKSVPMAFLVSHAEEAS